MASRFVKTQDESSDRPSPAVVATGYLALVSFLISEATGKPYYLCLVLIFAAALLTSLVAAVIAAGWFFEPRCGRVQIRLSWIFLITALLGAYLGLARWVLDGLNTPTIEEGGSLAFWLAVGLIAGLAILFSLPAAIFVGEAVLWFAVGILRYWRRRGRQVSSDVPASRDDELQQTD